MRKAIQEDGFIREEGKAGLAHFQLLLMAQAPESWTCRCLWAYFLLRAGGVRALLFASLGLSPLFSVKCLHLFSSLCSSLPHIQLSSQTKFQAHSLEWCQRSTWACTLACLQTLLQYRFLFLPPTLLLSNILLLLFLLTILPPHHSLSLLFAKITNLLLLTSSLVLEIPPIHY